jgi:plasmid stabilization system protein ParE
MNVEFLAPTRDEFVSAVEFYKKQAPGLGEELVCEVEKKFESLREHPRLGTPHTEGTRRVPLRRFPFNLVYHVESKHLVIVARR